MAVAVLVCFFIVAVRHLSGPPAEVEEPRYGGRPLSFWIEASKLPGTEGERAERIVRRAIPRLLRWLRTEPRMDEAPGLPELLNRLLDKQGLIRLRFRERRSASGPGREAAWVVAHQFLSRLGPARKEAIPKLIHLLGDKDEDTATCAGRTLQEIGPECIPGLLKALCSSNERARALAATALGEIGREPETVVPALRQAMKEGSVRVRFAAAVALSRFGAGADELAGALVEGIKGGDNEMRAEGFSRLMWLCESNRLAAELTRLTAPPVDAEVQRTARTILKSVKRSSSGERAAPGPRFPGPAGPGSPEVAEALAAYRAELMLFRERYGGVRELPEVSFFLFGMGHRTKMVYREGRLLDARSGFVLRQWQVRSQAILPSEYKVVLETTDGETVTLTEDAAGVWEMRAGAWSALPGTCRPVNLPYFAGLRFARILRVLHQELLFNVTEAGPVPNLFVYPKPWYRDGAMVALALRQTGNLGLLHDWLLGLVEPYDRNNAGEREADNLGQALFLVSLAADKSHPLVGKVLAEAPRFEVAGPGGKYLRGRSDFSEHPVYQTKWFKYGLAALGLPDAYALPAVPDTYSALFWMAYTNSYAGGRDADDRGSYPYLGWACDHFHRLARSPISNRDYPLTWEKDASQARYEGMRVIAPIFAQQRLAAPHTWHSAEVFLYLLDEQGALRFLKAKG